MNINNTADGNICLPDISVMVPCYNHANYIVGCLSSIVNAYSGVINIIFCDDCSGDDSYVLAKKYLNWVDLHCQGRITSVVYKNDKNIGLCATLNNMINFIDTEFVYLIASDDYLLPNALDSAVNCILKTEVDVLINDCQVVDEQGSLISESALFSYRKGCFSNYISENIKDEIVMNWIIPGPAGLFRTHIYSYIGRYDPTLVAEDRDFYLRVLAKCSIKFSGLTIACYRLHGSNSSKSKEYMNAIKKEMADINLKYRHSFHGLCYLYLLSYKFELVHRYGHIVGRLSRRLIYWLSKQLSKLNSIG